MKLCLLNLGLVFALLLCPLAPPALANGAMSEVSKEPRFRWSPAEWGDENSGSLNPFHLAMGRVTVDAQKPTEIAAQAATFLAKENFAAAAAAYTEAGVRFVESGDSDLAQLYLGKAVDASAKLSQAYQNGQARYLSYRCMMLGERMSRQSRQLLPIVDGTVVSIEERLSEKDIDVYYKSITALGDSFIREKQYTSFLKTKKQESAFLDEVKRLPIDRQLELAKTMDSHRRQDPRLISLLQEIIDRITREQGPTSAELLTPLGELRFVQYASLDDASHETMQRILEITRAQVSGTKAAALTIKSLPLVQCLKLDLLQDYQLSQQIFRLDPLLAAPAFYQSQAPKTRAFERSTVEIRHNIDEQLGELTAIENKLPTQSNQIELTRRLASITLSLLLADDLKTAQVYCERSRKEFQALPDEAQNSLYNDFWILARQLIWSKLPKNAEAIGMDLGPDCKLINGLNFAGQEEQLTFVKQ